MKEKNKGKGKRYIETEMKGDMEKRGIEGRR